MPNDSISFNGFTFVPDPRNVLDAALDRIRHLFSIADCYTVCMSGGKDSTTVLNLSLQVARELGRLPLEVVILDEEIIDPDTIAYCEKLLGNPELSVRWLCVNLKHTLRAKARSWWTTWEEEARDVWARPMPPQAVSHITGLKGPAEYRQIVNAYYFNDLGWRGKDLVQVTGVRIQESLNRARALRQSGNYYARQDGGEFYAKPIYDWKTIDVWRFINEHHLGYSEVYNKMWLAGFSLIKQRVAVWGNVASSREARFYQEFYPDFYAMALRRLPELAPMARYGNSKLFQAGRASAKPLHLTYQEYALQILDGLDPASKEFWANRITRTLVRQSKKSTQPLPEIGVNSVDMSWKQLCTAMSKNDRGRMGSRDAV